MTTPNSQENLEQTKKELSVLYEISNLMRTTLNLDQIFYIILTALTSHEGMEFNRAMLFLVNEEDNTLDGVMGIGPHTGEEADRIWKAIETHHMSLEDIVNSYDKFKEDPDSKLNTLVKELKIPLEEKAGILATTVLESMPFEISSEQGLKKVNKDVQKLLNLEKFVTIPLKGKNTVLGAILADNLFTKKPITKSDIRMFSMFANHAGLAIENSRLYEKSLLLSKIDWLTQVWNSGEFHSRLTIDIENAKKNDAPLSLAMMDLDNFKQYNDSYGHQKGDDAIRNVARILKESSRGQDVVARYGGEEFAMIMPFTDLETAVMVTERYRIAIEEFFKKTKKKKNELTITISIGVASFPENAKNKEALINLADCALYEAKTQGKNQTCPFRTDIKKFVDKILKKKK